MATVSADMMFQCVFDGSLSMSDMDIERRPYHKNCSCALHNLKDKCPHSGSRRRTLSFAKRKFGKDCSVSASPVSSQYSHICSSSARSRECKSENSDTLASSLRIG
ncbi:hypothetical protein F511_00896 [Dorcoceras hygrometricum]|nr:hypothetical protein F511_00896 [Dorcoceras hygrometricum]